MPRTTDSDDEEDFEYSPEADEAGVLWCPKCGAEMYGDATRCSKCGDDVTPGARTAGGLPWWIWAGLILIGVSMLGGFVMSLLFA